MKDLYKVNPNQLYLLWRNFAVSLLMLVALMLLNKIFPPYLAPVFSTIGAGVLYFMVYSNTYSETQSCMLAPYVLFLCLIFYTIALVVLNLLNVWTVIQVPAELIFFTEPYAPSLIFSPISLLVCVVMYLRRHNISICVDCRITNGTPIERGRMGVIFNNESAIQLVNLIKLFALITALAWSYYMWIFIDVGITKRDSYIFTWVISIIMILDVLYYAIRYYNLYLDLKERDEMTMPGEEYDTVSRTFLRFYVFCDDYIYLSVHERDYLRDDDIESMDTPFVSKERAGSFNTIDAKRIISDLTGVKNGVLRFFYGRRAADSSHSKIFRYFYFLPGDPDDYHQLAIKGVWISSDKMKTVFNNSPHSFSSIFLADANRLSTILITEKMYKANGERKLLLKQYRPSFNFRELRNTQLDFQDDKWLRVAAFNSDVRFFRFKRWLRKVMGLNAGKASSV